MASLSEFKIEKDVVHKICCTCGSKTNYAGINKLHFCNKHQLMVDDMIAQDICCDYIQSRFDKKHMNYKEYIEDDGSLIF